MEVWITFPLDFLLQSIWANADVRLGCLTITLIWGVPRSELSTMLTDPKYGTFSGLLTLCLTGAPLSQHHNSSPLIED